MESAGITSFRPAERRAQRADGIVSTGRALRPYGSDEVEFLVQRANSDTEDYSARADAVQRPVSLGDVEGMVVTQHRHRGS